MARRKHYNYYDDQFKATAVAMTNIKGVIAICRYRAKYEIKNISRL